MPLPDRPNLEYLKKLAKDRLHNLQRANPSAQLADAQLAVAREHGFASWRKLRAHLDSLAAPRLAPTDAAPALVEEFFGAVNRGDEAALGRMLATEPSLVNARHPDGTTPLLAAADHNKPGVIALLLDRGGDPGSIYEHSAHTPLSWALTVGSFDAAHALVGGGVEPDLFCAAGLGDVPTVESFFDADGRLEDGASATGSSRYAPDGSRLPARPRHPARSSPTPSTARAPTAVRRRCARSSPTGPSFRSARSRAGRRCTGPTSAARAAPWRRCSARERTRPCAMTPSGARRAPSASAGPPTWAG